MTPLHWVILFAGLDTTYWSLLLGHFDLYRWERLLRRLQTRRYISELHLYVFLECSLLSVSLRITGHLMTPTVRNRGSQVMPRKGWVLAWPVAQRGSHYSYISQLYLIVDGPHSVPEPRYNSWVNIHSYCWKLVRLESRYQIGSREVPQICCMEVPMDFTLVLFFVLENKIRTGCGQTCEAGIWCIRSEIIPYTDYSWSFSFLWGKWQG